MNKPFKVVLKAKIFFFNRAHSVVYDSLEREGYLKHECPGIRIEYNASNRLNVQGAKGIVFNKTNIVV